MVIFNKILIAVSGVAYGPCKGLLKFTKVKQKQKRFKLATICLHNFECA